MDLPADTDRYRRTDVSRSLLNAVERTELSSADGQQRAGRGASEVGTRHRRSSLDPLGNGGAKRTTIATRRHPRDGQRNRVCAVSVNGIAVFIGIRVILLTLTTGNGAQPVAVVPRVPVKSRGML